MTSISHFEEVLLYHTAKSKFSKEATQAEMNLRKMVGNANVLDALERAIEAQRNVEEAETDLATSRYLEAEKVA